LTPPLDDLKRPLPGLRVLYWSERVALVVCGVCIVYFVLGKLWADTRLGLFLWHKLTGAAAGFAGGLLFAIGNLLHLRVYQPLRVNFTAATTAIDQYYAAQGFETIPPEVEKLVADYEDYLEPVFFTGRWGFVTSALLGGVMCLGSAAVLMTFR
jgi:hypothetical protein